jgi:hypothetical protein
MPGHWSGPTRPLAELLMALNVRPRWDLSNAETRSVSVPGTTKFNERSRAELFISLLLAQTCPVLFAPRHKKRERR